MKLFFDHQIFNAQTNGGISRYFCELIRGLEADGEDRCQLGCVTSDNQLLQAYGIAAGHHIASDRFGRSLPGRALDYWRNRRHSQQLYRRGEFDLCHLTFYPAARPFREHGRPLAITIHDMTPEVYPELFSGTLYRRLVTGRWIAAKRELAAVADAIFVVSENTRNDLIRLYGTDPAKIHVTHLANSLTRTTPDTAVKLPERYLLFVGQRGTYKNFTGFIRAAAAVMERDRELAVVCIGGGALTAAEEQLLRELGIRERVHHRTVGEADLYHLYHRAQAMVYPSLYEGFGLPILEAFACGTPALLSRRSCFPEIGGDAARYFDPEDRDSMVETFREVLRNPELRADLIARGFRRNTEFSWSKLVAETRKVYRSLAGI